MCLQLQFSASICLERTMATHKRELPIVKGLHLMILFFLSAAEKDCEIKRPYKNKDAMLDFAAKDSSCSLNKMGLICACTVHPDYY